MAMEYPFEPPSVLFESIGMPMDTQIDAGTLTEFGKVLMTIVGTNGKISMWERGWLAAYLSAYGAPPSVMETLDDFDYAHAQLDPLLAPLLVSYYSMWVRRSLIQSAIRMSRADNLDEIEFREIVKVGMRLGLDEEVVQEIHGLVNIFDSVNTTSTQLLSAAQTEDELGGLPTQAVTDFDWDADPMEPAQVLLTEGQLGFARAVVCIMAADGEISDAELGEFAAYLKTWGATTDQIEEIIRFDYTSVTADELIEGAKRFNWGLSALTAVALRVAGADGLSSEEENALLELYTKTGRSLTLYYATKGLEDVRRMALNRLNALFAEHH